MIYYRQKDWLMILYSLIKEKCEFTGAKYFFLNQSQEKVSFLWLEIDCLIMQNFIILIFIYLFISVIKAENSIILQSTTSLKNSGFYDYILPLIYKDLGIKVNVVAVGTGAAIRNSMNCDGDLLIVHSPQQEQILWITVF